MVDYELQELQQRLSHLSIVAVEDFYRKLQDRWQIEHETELINPQAHRELK